MIDSESIEKNMELQEKYEKLLKNKHLGDQYVLIASYAKNIGITDLELSIHADDTAYEFIKNDVELEEKNEDSYYVISKSSKGNSAELFNGLRFPLLNLSKIDMANSAKERGFAEAMEKTWFCHTPTKKGEPCGKCNPCIFTVDEGLGRRLPFKSRIKTKPAKILKSLRRTLTK